MIESDRKIPEIGLRFRNPDEAWKFLVPLVLHSWRKRKFSQRNQRDRELG